MRYKLFEGSLNDTSSAKKTVLKNRGIDNIELYTKLSDDVLHSYKMLANIDDAVSLLLKHTENKNKMLLVVDSDVDGYTSSAILYSYIKRTIDPNANIEFILHSGKQHGLDDITVEDGVDLVIVPDAGSNDVTSCKNLKERNIDVLILDHHICDTDNPYAIIVNPQNCNYPNKNISGVAVVYKFLQALDEELWSFDADNYLDLVALGLIGDSMDLRAFETKRLVDKGLGKINNKLFLSLIQKQSYSMNNIININNVQFYIVPLINGMVRAGDSDEKHLMFEAFIELDKTFKYKPRKTKNNPEPQEIDESICDRVARLCVNAKSRQNRVKDKNMIGIIESIKKQNIDKNKIMFINVTDSLEKNLTGVVAMNVASSFNKPCLLLRLSEKNIYEGSGRNIDNSPIESLKNSLEETGLFEYASGHDNAFGVGIKRENIKKAISHLNSMFNDVDFSKFYEVDFVIEHDNFDIGFIQDMDELKEYYGQGIKEAYVVVKNISISKSGFFLMGACKDTWKFTDEEGIAFTKFKNNDNDMILQWLSDDMLSHNAKMSVVGRVGINRYNGNITPQIIVSDYDFVL